MERIARRFRWALLIVSGYITVLWLCPPVQAQLNQNCVVSVLNRTVQVNADGTWVVPNIPANFGPVRARASCVTNGVTQFGQSGFFTIPANGSANIPKIVLGPTTPIPNSVNVLASTTSFTVAGATAQLSVIATYAGGTTQDVTAATAGTIYNVSNPAIATVNANGLVTAVSSGTALIQAVNEGTQGILSIQVVLGVSHGGIPDSWALANGLDPTDPALPFEDPDHDGLTNLQEFQLGTNPNNPDSDRDGLTDGQEVLMYHTNPVLFSTDGSGISDGIEVQTGTLGLSLSQKLAKAISTFSVTPTTFVLAVNSIQGLASQQLAVKALLIDGKTTLDLTSTLEGTNYSSSDLTICNFGAPDGNVFAGNNGTCTITVTNSGFTATAVGTVSSFTPTPVSFVSIPGFANGVAVNGNYAFVAAGAAGLQVVNVSNRRNPAIVASLPLAGNANDVRLLGNLAYVAAGISGLEVVDVTNPLAPVLRGTLSTGGTALEVAVRGATAYIANTSNLLLADVTNPASMTQISTLPLSGTIRGLDVDAQRKLAVVAAGTGGIYVVDVSNPVVPVVRSQLTTAPGAESHDVAIKGTFAIIADYHSFSESYQNSLASVDISNPSAPVMRSAITNSNLGGNLNGVVISGNFALGADVIFVNGIPITDITDPTNLISRAILNFPEPPAGTFRDDNGMGIAADGSFVYLATEHSALDKFGAAGDSRLYIGQYLALQDLKGIPPTVAISSPAAGSSVIQGSRLPITVSATDDVAVAAVNFLVNGQVAFSSTSYPYQFTFTVPAGGSSLTLGATAVDFGGNVGTAQNVVVQVIPDPLTTVTGLVVDPSSQPVAGATVTVLGTFSTQTAGNGTFSISGVPTVQGNIVATAIAVQGANTLRGASASVSPTPGGITNLGTISLHPGSNILLLSDATSAGLTSLVQALTAAGNQLTVRPPVEYTWDNTNPPLTGFGCIIHFDGATPFNGFPQSGQQAIENFVQGGGGYITSGWMAFTQPLYDPLMTDFRFLNYDGGTGSGSVTYTALVSHPVLQGVTSPFTINTDGDQAGTIFNYTTNPVQKIMGSSICGGSGCQNGADTGGVFVRQVGNGRAVMFSFVAHWSGQSGADLADPNVQKLFINAVSWACK